MEVIQSFQVDHSNLKSGIYLSRKDEKLNFVTFDLRMTEPNKEPAINAAAMHTIEHLAATWFRNSSIKDYVVYVGPMGCMTGFYVILAGQWTTDQIKPFVIDCFKFIANFEGEVPGTTPATCGNYLMHDLPMAKYEADRYVYMLENHYHDTYKMLPRPQVEGNLEFHDA